MTRPDPTGETLWDLLALNAGLRSTWETSRSEADRLAMRASWEIHITCPGYRQPLTLGRPCSATVLSRDTADEENHLDYRGACLGCGWLAESSHPLHHGVRTRRPRTPWTTPTPAGGTCPSSAPCPTTTEGRPTSGPSSPGVTSGSRSCHPDGSTPQAPSAPPGPGMALATSPAGRRAGDTTPPPHRGRPRPRAADRPVRVTAARAAVPAKNDHRAVTTDVTVALARAKPKTAAGTRADAGKPTLRRRLHPRGHQTQTTLTRPSGRMDHPPMPGSPRRTRAPSRRHEHRSGGDVSALAPAA